MKHKLIQILLGALGSALTVIITSYTSVDAVSATTMALAAGPSATVAWGSLFPSLG